MPKETSSFLKGQKSIVNRKNESPTERYGTDTVNIENARIFVALIPEAEEKIPNKNIVKNTDIPDRIQYLDELRKFFYDKLKNAYENISHNPERYFNYKPYKSELGYNIPLGANYSYKNHVIKQLINEEERIVDGLRTKYIHDNFEKKRREIGEERKGIIAGPLINLSKSASNSNVNLINPENIRKNAESRRLKELNGLFGENSKKSQSKKNRNKINTKKNNSRNKSRRNKNK